MHLEQVRQSAFDPDQRLHIAGAERRIVKLSRRLAVLDLAQLPTQFSHQAFHDFVLPSVVDRGRRPHADVGERPLAR